MTSSEGLSADLVAKAVEQRAAIASCRLDQPTKATVLVTVVSTGLRTSVKVVGVPPECRRCLERVFWALALSPGLLGGVSTSVEVAVILVPGRE